MQLSLCTTELQIGTYVSMESKGWSKVSELSGVCDIWPVST